MIAKFITPTEPLAPSLFTSVADERPTNISWYDLYNLIKSDPTIKINTEKARAQIIQNNKKLYNIFKAQSGAFTPAAQCIGGHSTRNIASLTSFSMGDLDGVDPNQLPNLLDLIRKDPHTFMCYTTCSGEGIRIIFQYTTDQPEISYLEAWRWGNEYYKMITGIDYDKATKDPSRLSFLCYDPDCYYNPEAKPFFLHNEPIEPITDQTPIEEPIAFAERILEKQGQTFTPGHRHHYLINAAFLLNKMGVEKEQVISQYATLHDDPNEVSRAINWAYNNATSDHATWKTRTPKPTKALRQPNASEEKESRPSRAKIASPEQVRQWLQDHTEMRYNTITTFIEIKSEHNDEWTDIDDRTVNALWEDACRDLNLYIRQPDFQSTINSKHIETYQPFEHYIHHLPEWHEGDPDYLGELASRVKTTTDPALFDKCLRKWMVGMVASWLNPTITNQTILTLIGAQGLYKSTFFRMLLPPTLQRYFLAKGNSGYVSKDDKLATSNYGLLCLEEIDSMKDADLNAIKALVTTVVISERAAYARNRENRPHIASFCATGNNHQFLTDKSGNRRWLPFEVVSILDPYSHPINYEGLYAQIFYLIQNGYQYWFTREEDQELEAHKAQFAEACPEEELILRFFRSPKDGEIGMMKTATEIAARCRATLQSQISLKKVGMVLKTIGFKPAASNGKRGYIVVERSYEEINAEEINAATETLKKEQAQRDQQTAQQQAQQQAQQLELISQNESLQRLNNILNP